MILINTNHPEIKAIIDNLNKLPCFVSKSIMNYEYYDVFTHEFYVEHLDRYKLMDRIYCGWELLTVQQWERIYQYFKEFLPYAEFYIKQNHIQQRIRDLQKDFK